MRSPLLLSALIWVAAHSMVLAADEPEDPTKDEYLTAAALQNNLLFRVAIPRWEKVIAGSPDKVRIKKARYYVAICYFYAKQFQKSVERLSVALKNNPPVKNKKNASFRRDVMALLAASYLRLPDEQAGKKTLELLRAEFPDAKELAEQIESGKYPAKPPATFPKTAAPATIPTEVPATAAENKE
jgi:tetratricopeptide (TPR) repeat protein